jgi:hypothetical protein
MYTSISTTFQNVTSVICLIVLSFIIFAPASVAAQQLPSTDIYVVGMEDDKVSTDAFALKNITDRDGYDNQPAFTNDGLTIIYNSDASGTSLDIFRYVVKMAKGFGKVGVHLQMTYSQEDEFSPSALPGGGYSTVRVETDGRQRLWALVADALTGEPIFPNLSPVGYYAWIDEERVALFVLGAPVTLQIANRTTGESQTVASNIGRSIHRIPGSNHISFVHRESEEKWTVKRLNPDTGAISVIAPTHGDGQDFAWTPSGTLLMADGSAIFEWVQSRRAWRLSHDFSAEGVGEISRLAVNSQGGLLTFVAAR